VLCDANSFWLEKMGHWSWIGSQCVDDEAALHEVKKSEEDD
jgi:hypothetical protein